MYDKKGYKSSFLNTFADAQKRNSVTFIFHEIGEHEDKLDKDIIELSDEELFHFLKNIKWKSPGELSSKKTYINNYFSFHNNPYFSEYDIEELRILCTFTGDLVFSYEEIKSIESKLNSLENGWYYNAIMFCAFYGFNVRPIDEFTNLRVSNVDFENNVIKFDNGKIINMEEKEELKYYLQQVIANDCRYALSNATSKYIGLHEDSVFKVATNKNTKSIETALYNAIAIYGTKKIKEVSGVNKASLTKISYSGLLHEIHGKIIASQKSAEDYINDNKNNFEIQKSIVNFGKTTSVSRLKFQLKNYISLLDMK